MCSLPLAGREFFVNIVDGVSPDTLEKKWNEICDIIHSVPSYDEVKSAMINAGCKITTEDIDKDKDFFNKCVRFSPYMRKRLTLLRLKDMIES